MCLVSILLDSAVTTHPLIHSSDSTILSTRSSVTSTMRGFSSSWIIYSFNYFNGFIKHYIFQTLW